MHVVNRCWVWSSILARVSDWKLQIIVMDRSVIWIQIYFNSKVAPRCGMFTTEDGFGLVVDKS